jgi:hypothetical protein
LKTPLCFISWNKKKNKHLNRRFLCTKLKLRKADFKKKKMFLFREVRLNSAHSGWILRRVVHRTARGHHARRRQKEVSGRTRRGQIEKVVSEDLGGWRRERKWARKSGNVGNGSFGGSDGG